MCGNCNICKSADTVLEGFIGELDVETAHHRVEGQKTKTTLTLLYFNSLILCKLYILLKQISLHCTIYECI